MKWTGMGVWLLERPQEGRRTSFDPYPWLDRRHASEVGSRVLLGLHNEEPWAAITGQADVHS